jgi:hypothetical protein
MPSVVYCSSRLLITDYMYLAAVLRCHPAPIDSVIIRCPVGIMLPFVGDMHKFWYLIHDFNNNIVRHVFY